MLEVGTTTRIAVTSSVGKEADGVSPVRDPKFPVNGDPLWTVLGASGLGHGVKEW